MKELSACDASKWLDPFLPLSGIQIIQEHNDHLE
jgi:hypothetical protein